MMRRIGVPLALLFVCGTAVPSFSAQPTDSATAPLAKELVSLLEQHKLDSAAARMDGDTFVAALYLPGTELLVIAAKYSAPALLNEKILSRQYKEVYTDLSTASVVQTKVMIEDSKADGLRSTSGKDEPFDIVTRGASATVNLDGKWKDKKMTEEAYAKVFQDAEAAYRTMLQALIAELKKPR